MSWSISATGTVPELREQVHIHEANHWRHMALGERLMAHHVVGHAIELAEEHSRDGAIFTISANGHESGAWMSVHCELYPVHPSTTAEQPAEGTTE